MSDASLQKSIAELAAANSALQRRNADIQRILDRVAVGKQANARVAGTNAKHLQRAAALIQETATDVAHVQQHAKTMSLLIQKRPTLASAAKTVCLDAQVSVAAFVELRRLLDSRFAQTANEPDTAVTTGADADDATPDSERDAERARLMHSADLHSAIMRERRRDMEELADNVADINEIFSHIAVMIQEQGESLEVVATHVEAAEEETDRAVDQLRRAKASQTAAHVKYAVAAILAIIFLVIVIAVAAR